MEKGNKGRAKVRGKGGADPYLQIWEVVMKADKFKVFHRFSLKGGEFFPRVLRAFSASSGKRWGYSDRKSFT